MHFVFNHGRGGQRRTVKLKSQSPTLDKQLFFVVLILVVVGIIMVFNASVVDATRTFGDGFFYARRQAIWAAIGFAGLFFFSKINYKILERFAIFIFGASFLLLIAVLIPGVGVSALGAVRWIEVGPIVIQPSEFAKFALVIWLASVFLKTRSIFPFLFSIGLFAGLTILEPDLGTAIIISMVGILMYFAAGAPPFYFLVIVPLGLGVASLLILTSPYRKERLLTFLNPQIDPLGTSYHIRQILIALGSGGIFGVGLGQSRQKYLFLPEPTTDSILAIIGEELGFVGTTAILIAFMYLIWKGLTIAAHVSDPFGKLLAVGITSWVGMQAFMNIAAMVALVPLTGIPLPFFSYGGSSLVATLWAVGILLNVSKHQEAIR